MANVAVIPQLTVSLVSPAAGPTRVSVQTEPGGFGDLIIAIDEDSSSGITSQWTNIVSAVVSVLETAVGPSGSVTSDTITAGG